MQQGASTQELLPCPFCGSDGETVRDGDYAFVRCANDDCNIEGPVYRSSESAKAIAAWNTRSGPDRNAVLEEAAKVADDHAAKARERYDAEPPGPTAIAYAAKRNGANDIATAIRALTTTPEPTEPANASAHYQYNHDTGKFDATDPAGVSELIEQLMGPHEWGYRDPVVGGFIADDTPFRAADALRALDASGASTDEQLLADANAWYSSVQIEEMAKELSWCISRHPDGSTPVVIDQKTARTILAALRTPPVLEVAKEALEPFALAGAELAYESPTDMAVVYSINGHHIRLAHLRQARAALQTLKGH